MKTMLSTMKKRKNGISEDILSIFEHIFKTYSGKECDNKFREAMDEYLTKEQRFRLWEQNGGCKGTGHDKERKAFALKHADKPLAEKLESYINTIGKDLSEKTRSIILSEESKTITVIFACDECYRHTLKGNLTAPLNIYYEACAGGRLYNLQTALGIKLRIKGVDIPSLGVSKESPCVFIYDIVE